MTLNKGGRPAGFSPINGEGGAMVQTQIKTSLPQEVIDWLNSQSNKSATTREALTLLYSQQVIDQ
ncbi:MAG TPA: hypothetical protein V6C88_10360 [Chroococcidiopsis sp.]